MHSRPTFDLLSIRRVRPALPCSAITSPSPRAPHLSAAAAGRVFWNAKGHRSQKAAYLSHFHYQLSDSASRKVKYKIHNTLTHTQHTHTHGICISCTSVTFQKQPETFPGNRIEQTLTKQFGSLDKPRTSLYKNINNISPNPNLHPHTHTNTHLHMQSKLIKLWSTNKTVSKLESSVDSLIYSIFYFLFIL